MDVRCGFAADGRGRFFAAWHCDNRDFEEFLFRRADVYTGRIPLPAAAPMDPSLKPRTAPNLTVLSKSHSDEAGDLKRIRDYAIQSGGETYRIYRGDMHRHTEFSMDGNNDGAIQQTYRYAIDAAELDYLAVTDHNGDGGPDIPYINWLEQQMADVLMLPRTFTPLYAYERSLNYPNGHRNIIFAERGNPTLPIPEEEQQAKSGAKPLYEYLKRCGGIAISHTSATTMGTDWRDNDPDVEPLVEIYQGDRVSYEKQAAPRAGYDPKSDKKPANIAGWFPKGYINLALEKGYRLGFQSSSDHWSTHISYFIVLAERHDRAAILDAIKRRHVYGATDDIILDVRSGNHLMGDEFKTREVPKLQIRILGTHALARIDILKDSDVAHTIKTDKQEYVGTWTDPQPAQGVHYYYVRVEQGDGELAWASPIWIDYA